MFFLLIIVEEIYETRPTHAGRETRPAVGGRVLPVAVHHALLHSTHDAAHE